MELRGGVLDYFGCTLNAAMGIIWGPVRRDESLLYVRVRFHTGLIERVML